MVVFQFEKKAAGGRPYHRNDPEDNATFKISSGSALTLALRLDYVWPLNVFYRKVLKLFINKYRDRYI